MKVETPMLHDLITTITKYYPFSETSVMAVYNQCKSIDQTIASCEICKQFNITLRVVEFNELLELSKCV